MSGFVGVLHAVAPVDPALVRGTTDYLRYCGPDRQDCRVDGRVGLGHALLRTTDDTAAERQPLSLDGAVWIVADARVDGRDELRRALRSEGRDPAADAPDVELVLHAYHAWGDRCVDRLIGDFAFAVWDGRRQRLFCARDHFGVVPFYYATVPEGLIVGNVLSALRLHPAVGDALNEAAVGDFLLFQMNMEPATTTFADIRRLPAAHTLSWIGGAPRVERYWDLPATPPTPRPARGREHVERFAEAFDLAVGDRVRTRRVGAQLSGGMDSTSIAVTAHKLLTDAGHPFDLRAYTIVYEWLIREEEARYAGAVAASTGIPSERLVAEEYLTCVPSAAPPWVLPEPYVLLDLVAEYDIMSRVAGFARTLLAGFGGDPLFHHPVARADLGPRRWGGVARMAWFALADGQLPRIGLRTALRRRPSPPPVVAVPSWVDRGFASRVRLAERARQVAAEATSSTGVRTMLSPFWQHLLASGHPGAHGLPVRIVFPFFDRRLVRAVQESSPLPWRPNKRLLREAMRGRLPEAVRSRPKTTLYTALGGDCLDDPFHRLASRPESRGWRRELTSTPAARPYIDTTQMLAQVDSPVPGDAAAALLRGLTLVHWLRHQRRPDSTSVPRPERPYDAETSRARV